MTEQQDKTEPTPAPSREPADDSGKRTQFLIGTSILGVIVVVGLAISAVIAFRGVDEPLVPASPDALSSTVDAPSDEFEQDPYLDELGRVVYVPLEENGVMLDQTSTPSGRADTVAPSGVMLQRIHGNMIVPFSESDGPSTFTGAGVATGFARTAQGAGLAAAHYYGYLAGGNDRIKMLQDGGLVEDVNGLLAEQKKYNLTGKPSSVKDGSPSYALPYVKVDYNSDLSRVHLGITRNMADGSTQNLEIWTDLVWRDGTGWVVKIRDAATMGAKKVSEFGTGWSKWW
ncbi:hypothetical protein [Rhodococcus sp. NPDC058481]|uniref:hypothetical protein n=1 Tax=unclassified Rhodococcus (in: high G+C Gram-positive bacteria) TaxID=192944 RepID=UPI003651686D